MSSSAFGMLSAIGFFITLISLCIVPQYAQGITRHYEFNVIFPHRCLLDDNMFSIHFLSCFLQSFVDQDAKCDALVPHEEHGYCKWEMPWTSSCGKGGRPSSHKSHEPCFNQHHHPLV